MVSFVYFSFSFAHNSFRGIGWYVYDNMPPQYPSRQGTPRLMLQFRAQYQKSGTDCERLS